MPNAKDGIAMINPTAIGGEEWYLYTGGDPVADDPRFNAVQLTGNGTDGFSPGDDFGLMTVETSTGYNNGAIISDIDHSFVASTGYMYKSNDWKDVEITGLFNCSRVTNMDARIQFMARGAELSEFRPWCPGTFYMAELNMDGQFRWTKAQYHLSHASQDWIDPVLVGLGTDVRLQGWFGLKIVLSNIDIGVPGEGRQGVMLSAYIDKNNTSNWTLIDTSEIRDMGGWGEDGGECGGRRDQIITWGGPLVGFRFEWGSRILFNKLSVREVDVGGSFLEPEPTRQTPAFAAVSRVLTSTTHRYRIGTFIAPTCAGEVGTDPDPPPPDPPPIGTVDVVKKIAHVYDILKERKTIDTIDWPVRHVRSRAEAIADGDRVSVDTDTEGNAWAWAKAG